MLTVLRKIYNCLQSSLRRASVFFVVSRISERNKPAIVNRAIWRPFVADDYWMSLYKTAQSITKGDATDNLFRQCRHYSTLQLASYAASLPDGDVIECGCWHGHSTVAIATILAAHGFAGRFHVFDSFEGGLSGFTEKDESTFKLSDREKLAATKVFQSDFDFVKRVLSPYDFVELHRGWIPGSFAAFRVGKIRFVHIDVDMYEPTKASLEFFWDSLVPGGCLVVDDYNHSVFEGATRAVDDFLTAAKPKLFYRVPLGSCYLIK